MFRNYFAVNINIDMYIFQSSGYLNVVLEVYFNTEVNLYYFIVTNTPFTLKIIKCALSFHLIM